MAGIRLAEASSMAADLVVLVSDASDLNPSRDRELSERRRRRCA